MLYNMFILCRQTSGASIYIYKFEGSNENSENVDRRITITGNKESIAVAKYLIEMRYNFIVLLI